MTSTAITYDSQLAYAISTGGTSRRNNHKLNATALAKHELTAYAWEDKIVYFTAQREALMQQQDMFSLAQVDEGTGRGFIRNQQAKGVEYPVYSYGNKILHGAKMVADVLEKYLPDMVQGLKEWGINEIIAQKCGIDRAKLETTPKAPPKNYKEALLELASTQTVLDNLDYYYCDKPIANSFLAEAMEANGDNRLHGYITARELLERNDVEASRSLVQYVSRLLGCLCVEYGLTHKQKVRYFAKGSDKPAYSRGFSTAIIPHFPAVIQQLISNGTI